MRDAPPCVRNESVVDSLFRPQWAGGWYLTRIAWALAGLWTTVPRVFKLEDAHAAPDMIFRGYLFHFSEYFVLTPTIAYTLWTLSIAGLVMVIWGGRLFRPGILVWLIAAWILMDYEAINVRAYDRLMTWMALALFFSPAGERQLAGKYRSPIGRHFMFLVFCAIYGSTGIVKLMYAPDAWGSGEVLGYHLVSLYHGDGNRLAAWISGLPWLLAPMCWMTIVFEMGFAFLVWFRRTNPWLLLIGCSFHIGIGLMTNLEVFSAISIAAYPVLLHPEVARETYEKYFNKQPANSGPRGSTVAA